MTGSEEYLKDSIPTKPPTKLVWCKNEVSANFLYGSFCHHATKQSKKTHMEMTRNCLIKTRQTRKNQIVLPNQKYPKLNSRDF